MSSRGISTPGFHPEDAELVRRMRAGDESAFEEFFDASFDPLFRFAAARIGGDRDLAKEMAQAAICKAFEKLSTYRGEAPLFSWLCAICRFEISAHYRRERRQPPRVELPEELFEARGALESAASDAPGPESELLQRELVRRVHITIDHLPARYARVLEWRYADRLAVDEIAVRLGVSYKAAESLLSRSREAFRNGFQGLAVGWPLRGVTR